MDTPQQQVPCPHGGLPHMPPDGARACTACSAVHWRNLRRLGWGLYGVAGLCYVTSLFETECSPVLLLAGCCFGWASSISIVLAGHLGRTND
jgi:hypothetical protein